MTDSRNRAPAGRAEREIYEEVTTYGGGGGDAGEEIRQLEELLEKNPDNLDITEWFAFKLYSVGQYERAAGLYKRLIDQGHRPGVQYFYLGNTYHKMRSTQRAIEAWEKTIELIPTDTKALKAKARIDRISQGKD